MHIHSIYNTANTSLYNDFYSQYGFKLLGQTTKKIIRKMKCSNFWKFNNLLPHSCNNQILGLKGEAWIIKKSLSCLQGTLLSVHYAYFSLIHINIFL